MSRFTGEVAVVTGAGGGIGAATAARLATEVAAVALRDPTAPQHVVQKIGEIPGVARAYACDVTDEPAVQTVFARIAAEMGCPHILVNNAGITRDDLLFRLAKPDWDAVIAVNLTGAYLCAQAARASVGDLNRPTSRIGPRRRVAAGRRW